MTTEKARQFKGIGPRAYEHPADRAATSALHAIPLLDTVVKRLTDLGHERRTRQIVMGNAVRLGETQCPRCGPSISSVFLPSILTGRLISM